MKYNSVVLFFLFSITTYASADTVTCKPDAEGMWSIKQHVSTVNNTLSVGDDVPIGTVIYRARTRSDMVMVRCTATKVWTDKNIDLTTKVELINTPMPLVSGITAPPYNDPVYETNVPGIGISVSSDGKLPYFYNEAYAQPTDSGSVARHLATAMPIVVKLIKTGPVSPGVIDSGLFPSVQMTFVRPISPPGHEYVGFPVPANTMSFQGAIQIMASTCRIESPDVTVILGKHDVSKLKKAGVTQWVDATIKLIGCNVSPGIINDANTSISGSWGSGTFSKGTHDSNYVTLSINPTTALISSTEGIISLTPSGDNASGVAIQLGVYNKQGVINPFNFNSSSLEYYATSSTEKNIDIKLSARYIKTNELITPGKANGAVVYTIAYR